MVLVCLGVVPFALSGSLAAETASARERNRNEENVCTVWDKVRARKMCCRKEKVWKEAFRADTKMAVDGREMLPGSKGSVDVSVEEAPAASEYTKMGGCVGLRLSRVTWSYVLAESPFPILHSPSGLPTGIGHRGLPAVKDRPKYRRPPPTSQTTEDS